VDSVHHDLILGQDHLSEADLVDQEGLVDLVEEIVAVMTATVDEETDTRSPQVTHFFSLPILLY
jgi:hypothetical protein